MYSIAEEVLVSLETGKNEDVEVDVENKAIEEDKDQEKDEAVEIRAEAIAYCITRDETQQLQRV